MYISFNEILSKIVTYTDIDKFALDLRWYCRENYDVDRYTAEDIVEIAIKNLAIRLVDYPRCPSLRDWTWFPVREEILYRVRNLCEIYSAKGVEAINREYHHAFYFLD